MKLKFHRFGVLGLVGVMASAAFWLIVDTPRVTATCGTSVVSVNILNPTASATLNGAGIPLQAQVHANTAPTAVDFQLTGPTNRTLTGASLSNPTSGGTSPINQEWTLLWDSNTAPNGNYSLTATAHVGTISTYDCQSAPVAISIMNANTTPSLTASIAPATYSGTLGAAVAFAVSATYTDAYGMTTPLPSGTSYTWSSSGGSFSAPSAASTTFTPTATGTISLGVVVSVYGLAVHPTVSISIAAAPNAGSGGGTKTPTPTPKSSASPTPLPAASATATTTADTTTALTAQDIERLTSTPSIFRPAQPTNSAPLVPVETLGCLERILGPKYQPISAGTTLPTTSDRLKVDECFSGSNRIPAILAPVDPANVKQLATAQTIVTLAGAKNQTKAINGQKTTILLLSGQAAPNSSIFIYIFSDPMVLRATSDSNGSWNYELVNPLKPGEHEIYAVAAKDAQTFVRTPALPVSIATAASKSVDGSLIIEHKLQPVQMAFVIAVSALALAAMGFAFWLRRHTRLAEPSSVSNEPPV